jgi:acyl carrier protein
MNTQNERIHDRLTRIFQIVFDAPDLMIDDGVTAADVEGWDSLSHINLITAVEKDFKIRLTTQEIMRLTNVGGLKDLIQRKAGF